MDRFQAKTQDVLIQKKNVNALGLWWDQLEDTLSFKAGFKWDLKYTKRSALSFSNAVFDPLNWICPLHVQNRLLLRDLWSQKYAWDKSFHQNETLVKRWNYLSQNCFATMDIKMKLDIRIRDNTKSMYLLMRVSKHTEQCCTWLHQSPENTQREKSS